MKPYYEDTTSGITIYHGDCREILWMFKADLVLTDPPYGSDTCVDNARFSGGALWNRQVMRSAVQERRKVEGDCKPFDPTPLLEFKRLALFGANWYASRLPDSGGWIVWDKRGNGLEDMKGWPMGECELIWTNLADAVHVFRNRWMGLVRDSEHGEHYHPTQKPVALMRWLIERFTKTGERILDPYMGSGSTLVAAKSVDRRAIGIEIEERYCEIAAKRLAQSVMQFGRHCDETG